MKDLIGTLWSRVWRVGMGVFLGRSPMTRKHLDWKTWRWWRYLLPLKLYTTKGKSCSASLILQVLWCSRGCPLRCCTRCVSICCCASPCGLPTTTDCRPSEGLKGTSRNLLTPSCSSCTSCHWPTCPLRTGGRLGI